MRRGLHALLTTLILGPAAAGCVQATRHSNALIFGTNTSFGIQVGTNATQIPSVTVGYNRQEAVLVPLVANTGDAASRGQGSVDRLVPCNLAAPIQAPAGTSYAVHPCSLVGLNGKAVDSYSVLASFGAQFDAGGGTTSAARGGLAQYFATGVAAQLLAATGGASVIAVGPAATASALKAPAAEDAISALYGNSPAFGKGVAAADAYTIFAGKLEAKITLTDAANLKARVQAFEAASASPIQIADTCADPAACKAAAHDAYAIGYRRAAAKFEAALTAWAIP